ncbi:MAG: YqgE/AlgH family protein [Candidatus Lambdaproteobacteria bacterium]|nr:YqgE/AlgH family protein [Candidatus Lambdaproteobacteria bacterium]
MFTPPKILVAMPSLKDGYFDRSVILLCEHNEGGAMGFVINSPSNTTVDDLLRELNLPARCRDEHIIMIGGPVQPELCWVVHSREYQGKSTTNIGEQLALSAAQEVLTSICDGQSPAFYLVGVGYAGWGPGQLEQEIEQDAWWLADIDVMSVFDHPSESRWDMVMKLLGLNPYTATTRRV